VVHMDGAAGMRLVDDGDLFAALPWLVDALRLERGGRERSKIHRLRIAAVLRQCPKLTQVWFHDGPVNSAVFSPDGRFVLTVSGNTARVWNVATGQPTAPPLQHNG